MIARTDSIHGVVRVGEAGFICKCISTSEDLVLGPGSKIWHYCNILPGVVIGKNVQIGSYCEVYNATIEDGVRIGPYSHIMGDIREGSWIGPRVQMVDCKYPPSAKREPPTIGKGAIIGAGAIIMADVGEQAVIGAGTLVIRPIEKHMVTRGTPAATSWRSPQILHRDSYDVLKDLWEAGTPWR